MKNENPYDCIVTGGGPGGLQAALHLARFNRRVLVLDKGGGRTRHASHIENYLGRELVTGRELIEGGFDQVRNFGVEIARLRVSKVLKKELFEVRTPEKNFFSKFVIASTGATENLPRIANLHRFFAKSYFTCVDCDGYRTKGKKLVILGLSINAVRLAFAVKQMFTKDITLILDNFIPPDDFVEMLGEDGIVLKYGKAVELEGEDQLTGMQLDTGEFVPCEVILASFGYILNDDYLNDLALDRDSIRKITVSSKGESSCPGLYAVGAIRTGSSQAIIAAGRGAVAAIDINQKILEL
ncbi:MAG: NAD(P)/FAD-dependent oxidoreductase [Proteobacteria bacterium]|nr:NAD(P)/FAD-dependent oxidoreductase [Pseudomonadota bacterium]